MIVMMLGGSERIEKTLSGITPLVSGDARAGLSARAGLRMKSSIWDYTISIRWRASWLRMKSSIWDYAIIRWRGLVNLHGSGAEIVATYVKLTN
jgi:hypothetical protein